MNVIATLGLWAGSFLLLPKGWVATSITLWVLAKLNPMLAVLVFTGVLVAGVGR